MQEGDVRPFLRQAVIQAAILRTTISTALACAHPDDPATPQLMHVRHRLIAALDQLNAVHIAHGGEDLEPCPLPQPSAAELAKQLHPRRSPSPAQSSLQDAVSPPASRPRTEPQTQAA